VAILLCACSFTSAAAAATTTEDGQRAIASCVAMQRSFFDGRTRRYREQIGGDTRVFGVTSGVCEQNNSAVAPGPPRT
jgi:hypothetical protein